jgi:hypothetical protein
VKCILLGYYTLPGTQSKAYKCYDRVKRKVYKSRDVTFHERGKTSGWTEVITDLRNLPPVILNPPAAPEVPTTPENPPIPPAAEAEFFAGEDAEPEEQDESEVEEEFQVFAPEVAVNEPMAPRIRRLPLRFDGMIDERANLPKGRYKPKAAPLAPIMGPEPETEPDELEEEEEFQQAHARPARVPEPPIVVPLMFKQAMTSAHSEEWANAMMAEFGSLVDTGTFEYVDAPEGRKVITCKWVFSVKYNQWNEFERFKARLVARGFTQIYGIDYKETFAPVVKFTSLRIMFALAAHYGLTIYQMDVVTAFLNAELDEEIYMAQPPGLPPKLNANGEEMVLRLHKSIYGLKQASRQWYRLIDSIFKSLGFTRLQSDHSIYLCRRGDIIVVIALYVDDLQGATNDESTWNVVKSKLSARLKMKNLGVASYCLGLEIEQDLDAQTVRISQKKYSRVSSNALGWRILGPCPPRFRSARD